MCKVDYFQRMKEISNEIVISFLRVQRLERLQIIEKEYKDVLERVLSFNVFYVVFFEKELSKFVELDLFIDLFLEENIEFSENKSSEEFLEIVLKFGSGSINWDELVEKFFKKDVIGKIVFNLEVDVLN